MHDTFEESTSSSSPSSSSEEEEQQQEDGGGERTGQRGGNYLVHIGLRREDNGCPEGEIQDIYGYCRSITQICKPRVFCDGSYSYHIEDS